MIQKFLSGLNDKEKKILGIAMIVVLVALFDRLLISPTMAKLTTIEEQISAERTMIKRNAQFLSYREQIENEAEVYSQYYTEDAGSEKQIITQFLGEIEKLARKSNVVLTKINAAGNEHASHNLKYYASLECAGPFENVIDFIYQMETGKSLLEVTKMNLSPKRSDPKDVQSVMTVAKVIIPSGDMPDVKTLKADEVEGANP